MLGMGSPPFRGGINNPYLAHLEVIQYSGYYTVTIQSAIRYDASLEEYQRVKETLLNACCLMPNKTEIPMQLINDASARYKMTVSKYLQGR